METTEKKTEPALLVLRDTHSLLMGMAASLGDRIVGLEKHAEKLEAAVAKVEELWAADRAFNLARAHVEEAKRSRGNWAVNDLPRDHPAVRELAMAAVRRSDALLAVQE